MNPFSGWGISFESPWWLLLLLAIPLLAWLMGNRGRVASVQFSSTATLRALGNAVTSRRGSFLSSLFFLGLLFLILGMARPQAGRSVERIEASGIDIVLALDVSKSMLAEDFFIGGQRTNRLEAVKKVTREFIEKRPNDRMGIVAFAGRPYLVSPLTLGHDWLLKNLERVETGMVEDGTAIGSAIIAAANRLKNREAKSKVIVLLTDGDSNAGKVDPDTAAEAAKALGIKIYSIGAGSNEPAPWPAGRDPFGRVAYRTVLFPLDEASLQKVADTTGGVYRRATDTKSLEAVYEQIDKLERTTVQAPQFREYKDLFPWFVAAGLFLVVLEHGLGQTIWRRSP